VLGERDAAQAQALIQALCVARDKMISRMSRLEKYGAHRHATPLLGWRFSRVSGAFNRPVERYRLSQLGLMQFLRVDSITASTAFSASRDRS
jgi:hypothetical protein